MRVLEPFKDYFWDFYHPLEPKLKDKVDYVLQIVISVQRVPVKFFKHLEHGIQKKSQKTPRKEIESAKRLRADYYESKTEPR